MATIAEMFVEIGADASEFDREAREMQNQMRGMQNEMSTMADAMGTNASDMAKDWQHMSQEMQNAFKDATNQLKPFKQELQGVEYEFFQMAQGMKDYGGSTADFMKDLEALGKKQKSITDNMMKNNELMKTSFIQSIATMMARSTQSEKIAANFERMGNPLYTVNNGLLKITHGLENIAKNGGPAQLALEMLGPTANMKELNDMMRLINAGLMRFQAVALFAAVASAVLYSGLHNAASDTIPGYAAAWETMVSTLRQAFQPMVEVFAMIMIPVYKFITAIGQLMIAFNEAHPVLAKIIQGILMLVPILTLLLSPLAIGIGLTMGLRAAFAAMWMVIGPLITGLGAMMGTVLIVAAAVVLLGVALWALWTKTSWFKEAVIGAWEAIKNAAVTAFSAMMAFIQPAIDAVVAFVMEKWGQIKTFFDENGAQILQAATNVWNFISGVIQAAMMVIGAVMVFLWPFIKAMIISTWQAIQNVISGAINVILGIIKFFSALFTGDWQGVWDATKQILLGAVQLIWGLINLWFVGKFIAGFKVFATAGRALFTSFWSAVRSIFSTVFNAIKNSVTNTANAIRSVLTAIFNGIRSTITSILNGIRSTFTSVWNGIKSGVTAAVNAIRSSVQAGLNAIRSVVTSVLNGIKSAFTSAWSAIKSAVTAGVNGVKTSIQNGLNSALAFVKGLGSSFMAAGKGLIDMMASGIASAAGKVVGKVKELAGQIRDFLPFSPSKEGPLRDLDKLDFGGPIADSLYGAMPTVSKLMGKLMEMPDIVAPTPMMPTYSTQALADETKKDPKETQPQIINFERMFDGANINVNDSDDAVDVARELYNMTTQSMRSKGVKTIT